VPVVRVLRRNLSELGLDREVRVVAGDAPAAVRRLAAEGARFDLVLLDPPYAGDQLVRALTALAEADLVAAQGMVVAEHARRHPVPPVSGWVELDVRSYGDTQVTQLSPEDRGGRAPS
jgi:16S rRNA G966 N2-methylase RsmD